MVYQVAVRFEPLLSWSIFHTKILAMPFLHIGGLGLLPTACVQPQFRNLTACLSFHLSLCFSGCVCLSLCTWFSRRCLCPAVVVCSWFIFCRWWCIILVYKYVTVCANIKYSKFVFWYSEAWHSAPIYSQAPHLVNSLIYM